MFTETNISFVVVNRDDLCAYVIPEEWICTAITRAFTK